MARISPMEDAENFTSQILDTKKHRDLAKKNGILSSQNDEFHQEKYQNCNRLVFPRKITILCLSKNGYRTASPGPT